MAMARHVQSPVRPLYPAAALPPSSKTKRIAFPLSELILVEEQRFCGDPFKHDCPSLPSRLSPKRVLPPHRYRPDLEFSYIITLVRTELAHWFASYCGFELSDPVDMGKAEAARAIEPLCILWCIPGFLRNDCVDAFKLLT